MGIMANNASSKNHAGIASEVLKCLQVHDEISYEQCRVDFEQLTKVEQNIIPKGKKNKIDQYSMLVFRIHDQQGEIIKQDDYDIFLLAGKGYKADSLPEGFLVDKQMNSTTNNLVFYINTNKMALVKDGLFGVRIKLRPEKGFSYYNAVEYRSDGLFVGKVFAPNETTYIDITLDRKVDKNVFRFSPANKPSVSFKRVKPSGEVI